MTAPDAEAMQWHPDCGLQTQEGCAEIIVAWVNANGGEARYLPNQAGWVSSPRIAIRQRDGSEAYCAPGQWVVKGEWLPCEHGRTAPHDNDDGSPAADASFCGGLREFTVESR